MRAQKILSVLVFVWVLCSVYSDDARISHIDPSFNTKHTFLNVKWSTIDKSTLILAVGESSNSEVLPSKLFISPSLRETFKEIDINYPASKSKLADGLYMNGSKLLLTDSKSNVLCSCQDYRQTQAGISCSEVNFNPEKIIFHPSLQDDILIHDESTKKLFHSSDYGNTWELISEQVYSVYWENWSGKNAIYVMRREASGNELNNFNVIKSVNYFQNSVLVATKVSDFQMVDKYLFYAETIEVEDSTQTGSSKHINIYASRSDTGFETVTVYGDPEYDNKGKTVIEFFVADVADNQVFMVLSVYDKFSGSSTDGPFVHDLFISDISGMRFQQSLQNISYLSPKLYAKQWELLRASDTTAKRADFYSVAGLRGVFVATQIVGGVMGVNVEYVTKISYNKGASWENLTIPLDDEQQACKKSDANQDNECSIQLVQATLLHEGFKHLNPVYSSPAAPGMILGTGLIGDSIGLDSFSGSSSDASGNAYMFISINGGISFSVGFKGKWIYSFLDSGGFITAIDSFNPTQIVWYTHDLGNSWNYYEFSTTPMLIYTARSKLGEKESILYVFGSKIDSVTSKPEEDWNVVFVDFSQFYPHVCELNNEADYDLEWKVEETGRSDLCILGKEETFIRRKAAAECMNGENFNPLPQSVTCPCSRQDYACDLGTYYVASNNECRYLSQQTSQDAARSQCPIDANPNQVYTFSQSRGYRKVEGDECSASKEASDKWEPIHRVCPLLALSEFILLTDRTNVHRLSLDSNLVKSADHQVIDVGSHRRVTSLAYSYPHNVLFIVDKPKESSRNNMIKRLNLSDTEVATVVHEFETTYVHDIDVDFVNGRLYWLEQDRRKFSYSLVSSDFVGRMKRTVLNSAQVTAPKALALDPVKGYMFWMEWTSEPSISRATLDGRDVQSVVSKSLFWSESLSVDFFTDDPRGWIYWVESFYGRVERAHYDGSDRAVIVALPTGSVISSVAVFKDWVFVASEDNNTVGRADKDRLNGQLDHIVSVLNPKDAKDAEKYPSEMYAFFEPTHNVLSDRCAENNGGCSHICMQLNKTTHICVCPDNMQVTTPSADSLNETCSCPGGETPIGKNCESENGDCGDNMFTCDNKVCIPLRWNCDHSNDCGDSSDEKDCNYEKCQDYEFECKQSKKCIPKIWQCDFDFDCGDENGVEDRSDEDSCQYPECDKVTEFQCENQKCIPKDWHCDHDQDCVDHSDEDHCVIELETQNVTQCVGGGFVCDSTRCIPEQWRCDNSADCKDGADEAGCQDKCNPQFQFDCESQEDGKKPECVFKVKTCDGVRDCSNGADESTVMCEPIVPLSTAPPIYPTQDPSGSCQDEGDIPCPGSLKCIPAHWLCDSVEDCKDGADELDCQYAAKNCSHLQFKCDSGVCIDQQWRCDLVYDCTDQSDEKDCGDPAPEECTGFSCFANNQHYCLSKNVICDNYVDCPDGSDEVYCPNSTVTAFPDTGDDSTCRALTGSKTSCKANAKCFACQSDQTCLSKDKKCNNRLDCSDQSDEKGCAGSNPEPCSDTSFKCKSVPTECYPHDLVCNNVPDCQDKSDENPDLCNGIKNFAVLRVQSTNAAVTWQKIVNTSNVTAIWVKWRVKASVNNPGNWTRHKIVDLTSDNFRMTPLVPFTKYEVSVYLERNNKSFTEGAAPVKSFTTAEGLPGKPQKVSVAADSPEDSQQGSCKVKWSAPLRPQGVIQKYIVVLENKESGIELTKELKVNGVDDSLSLIIANLDQACSYKVQVAGVTQAGTGLRSDPVTLKFNAVIRPTDKPQNLRQVSPAVGQPITDSVTIQWDKVKLQNKKKPTYLMVMTQIDDYTKDGRTVVKLSSNQYTASNLAPAQKYSFEVATVFEDEQSEFSDGLNLKTSGENLPQIVRLSCSQANNPRYESVKLSWAATETKSKPKITGYNVYYGTTYWELENSNASKVSSNNGYSESTVVSNLQKGMDYLFAVRVSEVNGKPQLGNISRPLRCSTELDPGMPPRNLRCSPAQDDPSKMVFTWMAPAEHTLKNYTYRLKGRSEVESMQFRQYGKDLLDESRDVTYNVTFNNPGLHYNFYLEAKNSTGYKLNNSEMVSCDITNRNAPVMGRVLKDPNIVMWSPPEENVEPNEGYVVYGMEKVDDPEDQYVVLGNVGSGKTRLDNFSYPEDRKVNFVTVALKPYKLRDPLSNFGMYGPRGELAPPVEVYDISAQGGDSNPTFQDLVHSRVALKVILPLVFLVVGLAVTVVLLWYRQRQFNTLVNTVHFNHGSNGRPRVTILGNGVDNADDVEGSSVPYGRLQASMGEDYDDDVMLVNT